tara:strand:+ start:1230 stop:1958 length:729 start_codon:yes stop_codon:yes gene_type:complete
MRLLPAIDILDGSCVRLNKGKYNEITKYSDDPLAIATKWYEIGIRNIHIVDLNGAKTGELTNFSIINKIRESLSDLYIQVGGGIRTRESIDKYLKSGIDKIIIGTKALTSPEFLGSIPLDLRKRIIIDVAMNNNVLASDGWIEKSEINIVDFIKKLETNNITELVVTDISKDGMLSGINQALYKKISSLTEIPIIVSGGVTTLEDIHEIISMRDKGLSGIIIGKAIYENRIKISDLVKLERN